MSNDSFTEVTNQSWFGRIGGAIKGILVGLILFIVAFPLLFWNEGRSVKRYKTLKEGGGAVISITADRVDNNNEGKLVHMTGTAVTDQTLTDPIFGISANALKLRRTVEMYQWEENSKSETKKKVGGGTETVTTYSYNKTWASRAINSGSFKRPDGHQNPGEMPYSEWTEYASPVTIGAFTLSPSLLGKVGRYQGLPVSADEPLPAELEGKATVNNSGYYIGNDPGSPQVGDVRIKFQVVNPTEISLMAKQVGNTFEPYKTSVGGTIELLRDGVFTAEAMIEKAQQSNRILTWVLRLVGFLLMLIGLNMIFKPLSVVADVLPFLGSIVGAGTGIISFLIALILSLVTIAIAWIFYRPLLAIGIIAVVVVLIVLTRMKVKKAPKIPPVPTA